MEALFEFLKIMVDLVRGVAWPLTVLVIAMIFKADISNILKRIRKLTREGVEVDPLEQPTSPPRPLAVQQAALVPASPMMQNKEREILLRIGNVDQGVRDAVLLRNAAIAELAVIFENAYGSIFGTQIRALRQLAGEGRETIERAREYFETEVRTKFPDAYRHVTLEKWAAFLVSRGFIIMTPEHVEITELGREFVKYLNERDYRTDKML